MRHQAQCLMFRNHVCQGCLEKYQVQVPDQKSATANVQVRAVRPGTLIQPDLALAQ